MTRDLLVVASILVVLGLAGATMPALAQEVPATTGRANRAGLTPATAPAMWQPFANAKPAAGVGKWHPYELQMAHVRSGDAKAMWFASGAFIWRYDVQTRRIESWSALDGLPPGGLALATLIADGRGGCAALFGESAYLWNQRDGWRALPAPDAPSDFKSIALDGEGQLLFMLATCRTRMGTTIWRWQADRWVQVVHSDEITSTRFCPTGDGQFLVSERVDSRQVRLLGKDGKLVRDADGQMKLWRPDGMSYGISSYIPLGDRVLCVAGGIGYGQCVEYAKGNDKLKQLDGAIIGVDLAAGGYIRKVIGADKKIHFAADDGAVAEFPFPAEVLQHGLSGGLVFRDANKDFWFCDRRWSGKKWEQVAPQGQMSVLPWGVDQPRIICRDVTDPALWREPHYGWRYNGGLELLMIEDWNITVLATIKDMTPNGGGIFRTNLCDPKGRVWGNILEWRGTGNSYPRSLFASPDGTVVKLDANFMPTFIDATGQVWLKGGGFGANDRTTGRYNEATSKVDIVPKETAMDALAVHCGPFTIAPSLDDANGDLYEKVGGEWKTAGGVQGHSGKSSQSMVCGDRMLIWGAGVSELDAGAKRWIRLADGYGGPVYFDSKGRRVLPGLIFDGDPFETENGLKGVADDRLLFADLLKRMDAADFHTREAASEELKQNYPRLAMWAWEAAARENISAEVRTRLQGVFAAIAANPDKSQAWPINLFLRMHPPLRPKAAK